MPSLTHGDTADITAFTRHVGAAYKAVFRSAFEVTTKLPLLSLERPFDWAENANKPRYEETVRLVRERKALTRNGHGSRKEWRSLEGAIIRNRTVRATRVAASVVALGAEMVANAAMIFVAAGSWALAAAAAMAPVGAAALAVEGTREAWRASEPYRKLSRGQKPAPATGPYRTAAPGTPPASRDLG